MPLKKSSTVLSLVSPGEENVYQGAGDELMFAILLYSTSYHEKIEGKQEIQHL